MRRIRQLVTGAFFFWILPAPATALSTRCVMYLTGQHTIIPREPGLLDGITHVILAFMKSDFFNSRQGLSDVPLFTSVKDTRSRFPPQTKIMIAIGGWGDSLGFEEANKDPGSRAVWCNNVKQMIDYTGADGIDIDWEYPGGNRDDYKLIPNEKREWEIEAFIQMLTDTRAAIGQDKLLSIAVPGLKRDLMAFTAQTIPRIADQVDFINVMTYDLLNRRDTILKHHSGVSESLKSIQNYIKLGVPPRMLNLGLAYFVKWAMTEKCDPSQLMTCPAQLLEDPETGADLGRIAAFSWHDEVPLDLERSFARSLAKGQYFEDGSFGYWDQEEHRWWTFDTEQVIGQKIREIVAPQQLGGVFAWGLGEDAPGFSHLAATIDSLKQIRHRTMKDEL